jgi:putative Mn2+ efflux pump MntP
MSKGGFMEIFLIALGLSADCFAVSLVCGVREKKLPFKFIFQAAFLFGFFQSGMAALGYFFGSLWAKYVLAFGHWISFGLLAFVGGKMILESLEKDCECKNAAKSFYNFRTPDLALNNSMKLGTLGK